MNLIDLELGKWLYFIIYFFFPTAALLYLIHNFGLDRNEDYAETARKHIEQANYWSTIALEMIHSGIGTKSIASLINTAQRNLEKAAIVIDTAELSDEQFQSLIQAYNDAVNHLVRVQESVNAPLMHPLPFLYLTR